MSQSQRLGFKQKKEFCSLNERMERGEMPLCLSTEELGELISLVSVLQ